MGIQAFAVAVGIVLLILVGVAVIIAKFYLKVEQGKALIINKMREEPEVTFTGGVVIPIIHKAEVMDISVKAMDLERSGHEGLICADNIRADIKVTFFVRVNKTKEDVLKVAQAIGCARASHPETLEGLFTAKFSEALKTVGKRLMFEELYTKRDDFKDQIIEVIGQDLNGYALEDAAIDYLEQTPMAKLDPANVLDAQGIRKITQLTAEQNVQTNELKQKERMEIGRQNLSADEAVYRFEHARADALARKDKEIAVTLAREVNEADRVKADEEKRTALTRQKANEEVEIGEQNKKRAVEVALKAREREIAVEQVRVRKAADLEELSREREVELKRIEKEKAIEQEKKEIADVVRGRIAVEKTVAEEEERINDLRAFALADRTKKVVITTAEGEAQQGLVKQIKAAEAMEEVAKFEARKKLIGAEADLETADKLARAKIRLAEGVQAETAAGGLAAVRVQEAEAVAIEKRGIAEAKVTLEKTTADARGLEQKGVADAKVRELAADVRKKEGEAEADVIRNTRAAEAVGDEQKGMAATRVKEAEAAAIAKRGEAEAKVIEDRLSAEATGLARKADAMKALDPASRAHEEFRFQLEKDTEVRMHRLDTAVAMAAHQAQVMGAAMQQAKINIVGGDGAFFDRFVKAVSMGQSLDGLVDNSEVVQTALGDYLKGERSLPEDVRQVLSGIGASDLKNLSVARLLSQLAGQADGATRAKLEKLAQHAANVGLGASED